MFVVDTNILLYAADRDFAEHGRCRELLLEWRAQATPWYLTWGILYEFLRVVTHPKVLRKPFTTKEAWAFVEALLASPSLGVLIETERHAAVAAELLARDGAVSGNLVFDARTAILMKEHGLRTIYTRDMDFHRFSHVEVIDPLQA